MPQGARTEPSPEPARLDLFKTLGDNTRYAIYLELARASRPLTTAEIADTTGLHHNTVRPHLERMRDVGLIEIEVGGRGQIGRPQHRYSLAAEAPGLGLEPPVLPVLARMVLAMAERLGADRHDARAVGADEGRRRAVPFGRASSSLEALVSDLDRLGFDPVVSDPDDANDTAVVAFANCPFGELARDHADLVCSLHHGLVEGFIDALGDARVSEFCSVVHRTPCQVTVGERASAAAS
ncbi:MAG TPA: helix-turn-helix domain-containing protein [Ilumatobacter sp.]